jgi:hypothetical protein
LTVLVIDETNSAKNSHSALLTVIGQNLRAGFAELGAVLLETRQHGLVAVIDVSAAEPRDVPRAGVVPLLLRRRDRYDENKWNDEKKSGHGATPTQS